MENRDAGTVSSYQEPPKIDFWTPRRRASFVAGLVLWFCVALAFGYLRHP